MDLQVNGREGYRERGDEYIDGQGKQETKRVSRQKDNKRGGGKIGTNGKKGPRQYPSRRNVQRERAEHKERDWRGKEKKVGARELKGVRWGQAG